MWLWIAVTSIPWARSAFNTGVTSFAINKKSPVIAAFAPPGGLKIDRISGAHWRRNVHSIVFNRLCAGNAELVDAAVISALGAEGLIDRRGVEIDLRWRCRRGSSRGKRRLAFHERRMQRRCQFHRIAVAE